MKSLFAAFALLSLCAASSAQITSIPQFTGTDQEGFEVGPQVLFLPCIPQRAFNNKADVCTPGHSGCHTTTGWGYVCSIYPHGGNWLYASADYLTEITFDTPISRFGGFFGTNCGIPNATVEFYDASGGLLSSTLESLPADCSWYWLGWAATGAPIKSVRVIGQVNSGAYVMMDDLEADYGPNTFPPTAYCTAGTSSNGCVASISANANPNVSHSTPCNVTIANVEGQRSGIIFYGLMQTSSPWCSQGGGTSMLCVKAPTKRTGVQQTGGTMGACNGSLARDWNAYQLANPGALGAPWVAGEQVFLQGWFRDPTACKTTNLSNGLQLTYTP